MTVKAPITLCRHLYLVLIDNQRKKIRDQRAVLGNGFARNRVTDIRPRKQARRIGPRRTGSERISLETVIAHRLMGRALRPVPMDEM